MMAHIRKTKGEFELQANYGYGNGWECICSEETMGEICQRLKKYRDNDGVNYRIVDRRVKIDQGV